MNSTASPSQRLKSKFVNGETVFGLWVTLQSATVSEMAGLLGLDWICVDMEHSSLDLQDVGNHLRALSRSSTVGLVRISGIDHGLIQKVFGLGAHGILVPRIKTAEEVARAVSYAKYPPQGLRGMGVERATLWGRGRARAKTANGNTMVFPMIETVDAGKNIESIMQVPGIDGFVFGPADYSAAAGFPGEWEGPGVAAELIRIKDQIRARHFPCGVAITDPANGHARVGQGFQMIALGVDSSILIKSLAEMLTTLGRSVDPDVWNQEL
jgi:2-keto-3-deoxy-L-rhamnonate aldolase RhmA